MTSCSYKGRGVQLIFFNENGEKKISASHNLSDGYATTSHSKGFLII